MNLFTDAFGFVSGRPLVVFGSLAMQTSIIRSDFLSLTEHDRPLPFAKIAV
jgi:hypothetical protein